MQCRCLGRLSLTNYYNSLQLRNLNSLSAAITKPHRRIYERTYPVMVVNPDGSTFTIRYHEPRKIITLPINIWTLSEAERKERLERRKPRKKIKIEEDIDDDFDSQKYIKYIKK
ncbi:39S ribosomal protein L55, mitochondrial [Agrilus planipennis]|uniref:39S ribosomal protein L55, mitochondrial n=1 Tax=Agrilus planipennis TaxID=224129 RepID=A0A1W4XV80_AGRPL|nr:39S ribosomal protein L55, mitochondrial [Agrilus planipennis]